MNSEEVLERVKEIFAKDGSILNLDRLSIDLREVNDGSFFSKRRKKIWHVMTNVGKKGGNEIFEFDDETGKLLKHLIWPK